MIWLYALRLGTLRAATATSTSSLEAAHKPSLPIACPAAMYGFCSDDSHNSFCSPIENLEESEGKPWYACCKAESGWVVVILQSCNSAAQWPGSQNAALQLYMCQSVVTNEYIELCAKHLTLELAAFCFAAIKSRSPSNSMHSQVLCAEVCMCRLHSAAGANLSQDQKLLYGTQQRDPSHDPF